MKMTLSALCCAVLLALTTSTGAAEKPVSKKAAKAPAKAAPKTLSKTAPKKTAKAVSKAAPKTAARTAPRAVAKTAALKPAPKAVSKVAWKAGAGPLTTAVLTSKPPPPSVPRTFAAAYRPVAEPSAALKGKTETLTCTDGTEDRHARIGVVTVGGKVDSFAYYSKWKPRTCSIYLQRNRDSHSKWLDKGSVTNVNLERGVFLIEHSKNEYRFVFRDIDRERYCGMEGAINGTLTIRRGSELCEVAGIMEEGVPLGQAYAHAEQAAPAATTASAAPEPAPAKRVIQRSREPQSTFPSAAAGISD